jgi:hypothetical protein
MFFTIYKTTNKNNGKYYIGAHKTKDINDNYIGSGVYLKRAIEKYGRNNFEKEILFVYDNEEEMFLKEQELVVIDPEISYNMTPGGKGGFDHIDNRGDKNPMKQRDVAVKNVESHRLKGSYNTEERQNHLKNMAELARVKNTGKKRPEHSKFMKEWAKENWKRNKESMRDSLSSTYELTSPSGEIYVTNRLGEFCEINQLTFTTIWRSSVTGNIPKKGKCKGWKCKKL